MKTFIPLVTLSLLIAACAPASPAAIPQAQQTIPTLVSTLEATVVPSKNLAQSESDLLQFEASSQISNAADASSTHYIPSAAPVPVSPDIGQTYSGYWFKFSKELFEEKYQILKLMYQDDKHLEVIAEFCSRASGSKTPAGFYFIMDDKPTYYPSAPGEFGTMYFPHNYQIIYASSSWYIHSSPWNTAGEYGCPTKRSGGCVNMRSADFDLLLNGGEYTNPFTGEHSVIPKIDVGTPVIITDTDDSCRYLGNCMEAFACDSLKECFEMYSCVRCENPETKWNDIKNNFSTQQTSK